MSVEIRKGVQGEDVWSRWFMQSQVGGNEQYRRRVIKTVEPIRNRVINGAQLQPGMTLLDVGTGYGAVAFDAIARIGPSLRVIMSDVSEPLLNSARLAAKNAGLEQQCSFVRCSAEKLQGITDHSVDAICLRSVLAFVADKTSALHEFFRVLRPDGRLSIAEPIMQDDAFEVIAMTRMLATQPTLPDIDFMRLVQRWRSLQLPTSEVEMQTVPETNFSERDLVHLARAAGFGQIHMELHMDVVQGSITDWELFLDLTPLPRAPNLRQIMATHFSPADRQLFEKVLRPRIEHGQTLSTEVTAYLTAQKPAATAATSNNPGSWMEAMSSRIPASCR